MVSTTHNPQASHLANRFNPQGWTDRWLFQTVLPHWASHGHDANNGLFVEALNMSAAPLAGLPRRGRVIPRQIFSFVRAIRHGFDASPALLSRIRHAADRMLTDFHNNDRGFASLISAQGEPSAFDSVLYDHAFVALAGAELQTLKQHPELAETGAQLAARAFAHNDEMFRDHEAGGFYTIANVPGPKLANPHMHLLEASLAQFSVDRAPAARARIEEITALFMAHFLDSSTGLVAEQRARDFSPMGAPWYEPGHCYEWAFLMQEAARALDSTPVLKCAQTLFTRSESLTEADGLVMDRLDAPQPTYRLWPQLERLRCLQAFGESDRIEPLLLRLIDLYFSGGPDAGWIDRLDATKASDSETVPASMLYHLMTAIPPITRPGSLS